MHTKHTTIHDRSESEIIKHFTAPSPYVAASVLPLTFIVEPINLCDLLRLVITTNERYSIWVPDFESQEKQERLYAVKTAIDKVT